MQYRTVNLLPQTYDRLRLYKLAGKSFDDVLLDFMGRVRLEEYHRDALWASASSGRGRQGRERLEREMARGWASLVRTRTRRRRERRSGR